LKSRREIFGDFDLYVPPAQVPAADLDLRVPARSSASPRAQGPGVTKRPARRRSRFGVAALAMLLSACAAFAGEYVVRGMETRHVESLVATLNNALSSAVPFLPPLPSAALVPPLQSSLPSEQRLLDSAPGGNIQTQPDRRRPESKSKDKPAVTAVKSVPTSPAAVATAPSEHKSASRSPRPVEVFGAPETSVATPPARSTPPAPRADQGVLQTNAQEQRGAIEDVLKRYELAYRNLDAGGAKSVWPAVDERTLSRTFEALSWQEVRFDRCVIHVSSPDAEAVCAGVATYVPKAGNRQPRSERRRWTFQLRMSDGAWTIARAEARQDDRP
jgi:hypothetical protein